MDYTPLVSANCLNKGPFLLGDKNKQAQTLPLKEDFRQVPGQVTGQVFQTTWRRNHYTSMQMLLSKTKQVLDRTIAAKVPLGDGSVEFVLSKV